MSYAIIKRNSWQERLVHGQMVRGKFCCNARTGGGKTVIFAAIASQFVRHQEEVLVIAHREELILQAAMANI